MNEPARQFKNDDFAMLARLDYFKRLAADVRKAKKGERVLVMSMGFSPEKTGVDEVASALINAAKRGVRVTLIIDAFEFLINGTNKIPGPLWRHSSIPKRLREPYRTRWNALQALAAAGGRYAITNMPRRAFTIPYSGRSHIKAVVIGNDLVYTGNCNLNDPDNIDMMLRFRDARTATWLGKWLEQFAASADVRGTLRAQDQVLTLDNKTRIIIDAGVPKQSAIFDEALAMINNAQEWLMLTSQYFAPGEGTKALARALKRGVKITYYYSHYSMHGPLEGLIHGAAQWRMRRHLPAALFEKRLPRGVHLHAKVLATEHGAIIGSHNFGDLGVQLGTAEIALHREDQAFAKKAAALIEAQLSANSTK